MVHVSAEMLQMAVRYKKYGYKAGKGLGPHATLGLQYALMALSAAKNYREYWLKDIELGRIN